MGFYPKGLISICLDNSNMATRTEADRRSALANVGRRFDPSVLRPLARLLACMVPQQADELMECLSQRKQTLSLSAFS